MIATAVAPAPRRRGSLDVVGVGISSVTQTTLESQECIRLADRVFYLVNDPVAELWLMNLNSSAKSLARFYGATKDRQLTYAEMAACVIRQVMRGHRVCMVFYGHPGVFVQPSHLAIEYLKARGYPARMLPGISTDACMFCDLGFNPGDHGIQSFEATNFLLSRRRFDPASGLILWQAGVLGESTAAPTRTHQPERLQVLVDYLRPYYPQRHPVTIYQAAKFPSRTPMVATVQLSALASQSLTPLTTLYVPPRRIRRSDRRIKRWLELDGATGVDLTMRKRRSLARSK